MSEPQMGEGRIRVAVFGGGAIGLPSRLKAFRGDLRRVLESFLVDDAAACRFWILMDLGLTGLIGFLADDVLSRGLDHLDNEHFHDWLKRHGLSREAQWSPPLRLVYEVIFAYRGVPHRTRTRPWQQALPFAAASGCCSPTKRPPCMRCRQGRGTPCLRPSTWPSRRGPTPISASFIALNGWFPMRTVGPSMGPVCAWTGSVTRTRRGPGPFRRPVVPPQRSW